MLYTDNPKDATRKLVELMNEFGKVVGYKINIHKFVALLYTNDKISDREIKEITPFTMISKRTKYLGINLPKGGKKSVLWKYKTLMKEIKDDINRWEDILCYWVGRIIMLKWPYYTRKSTDSMHLYQIANAICQRTRTKNFKFVWKQKRPQIAKTIL